MKTQTKIEKRIRLSGLLLIAGLLVELVTMRWSHPTAFLFFLLLGGMLMAAGILIYLFSLASISAATEEAQREKESSSVSVS